MWRILASLLLLLHGLVHLMGFAVYLKLARIAGLTYPTGLLGGRVGASTGLVSVLGVLWLVAAAGFVGGAIGLATGHGWWRPVVIVTALLSLVLCALGWPDARAGVIVDIAILAIILLGALVARARAAA